MNLLSFPNNTTMNDLKFAFRQLLKNPGFNAVAVLTLAICPGVNLTIFGVIDSILLGPQFLRSVAQRMNLLSIHEQFSNQIAS